MLGASIATRRAGPPDTDDAMRCDAAVRRLRVDTARGDDLMQYVWLWLPSSIFSNSCLAAVPGSPWVKACSDFCSSTAPDSCQASLASQLLRPGP